MSQQSEFEQREQINREIITDEPDWRERPEESSAREQPAHDIAAQPMGAQKIYPRRQRRGWLWALLAVLVILALLIGAFGSNSLVSKSQSLPQQTFSVSGTPSLVINDAAGAVKIHQGSGNSIIINATAHGGTFSNLSSDTVDAKQNGSIITVLVGQEGSIFNHGTVDLDITLPANSNIQATVHAGNLDVNGVSGQMDLKVDAGELDFENGTISGQSTFADAAGAINFDGSIAPNGNYSFKDTVGAINLTLPSTVSFTIDASSRLSNVTNDFGTDTVGSNPTSQVHIQAGVGAVTIHKK